MLGYGFGVLLLLLNADLELAQLWFGSCLFLAWFVLGSDFVMVWLVFNVWMYLNECLFDFDLIVDWFLIIYD